ncbi:GATA zinc finger domain-containing protein 4-like [Macrosteles quadrilineatus]|uniref:GATA zinc finger domain-containing protein 4-like n=1 Tax=Macrosteles quadrilineatus TaxID=74068 RepID=UPI0023E275A3|nr:GATA zinc finger domain-containing protein 4-like [Macrosteles quadrilineatus]
MKSTVFLYTASFILYVAVDSVTACIDGEFMRDPSSCDHFYKCDHGQPVKFSCGPGTWFNPKINVCDWPYNVKCDVNNQNGKPTDNYQYNDNIGGNTPNNNNYGGQNGQNKKPSNQGQNHPDQDSGYLNPSDEGYLWPIQGNDQNYNGGGSGNGENRPRPTIDDLYNSNNRPYQDYIGNNRV